MYGVKMKRPKVPPVINLKKTVEVDGTSSVDFSRWKVNDVIMNYVRKFKSMEPNEEDDWDAPKVEGDAAKEDYDHGKRLAEIYA